MIIGSLAMCAMNRVGEVDDLGRRVPLMAGRDAQVAAERLGPDLLAASLRATAGAAAAGIAADNLELLATDIAPPEGRGCDRRGRDRIRRIIGNVAHYSSYP